ncbi:MAG TPA: hypothetical protein VNN75_08750, partial [Stellaceae bacterium]|nr:hypothetical protein [Stellaceae bacterium]
PPPSSLEGHFSPSPLPVTSDRFGSIKDVQIETLPEERCVRTAEVFGRFYVIGAEADPPAKWPFPH